MTINEVLFQNRQKNISHISEENNMTINKVLFQIVKNLGSQNKRVV